MTDRIRSCAPWIFLARFAREITEDRLTGVAAEVAFYSLLSIPSLLLVLAGVAGYADGLFGAGARASLMQRVTEGLGSFLSPDTMRSFVGPAVERLFAHGRAGLLSVGALLAFWSLSRLFRVMIEATNIAYDVESWRPTWRRRLLGLGMSVGGIAILGVGLPLLVAGPGLGAAAAERYGAPSVTGTIYAIAYWPVSVIAAVALLATFYHLAPRKKTAWRNDIPGAFFAAVVWTAAAFGLRTYVSVSISEKTAGPLAAPTILMLWLYASALAVLLGAELNSTLTRFRRERAASPAA